MALGDKYKVTLVMNWAQNPPIMHCVWHYEEIVPGSPSGAEELADNFDFYVIPKIKAVQADEVRYVELRVENVVPSADNYTKPYVPASDSGAVAAGALPSFVGYNYAYNRTTREVRNGRKNIPGVPEPAQEDGVLAAAYATVVTDLASVLAANLTPGGGNPVTWSPRIWRKFRPAKPDHVPPLASVPEQYFPIAGVQFTHIGRQGSRTQY